MAAKRQGLNVSEKQVKDFLATRAEKQQFQAPETSKGKIASETMNARYQMDIMDTRRQKAGYWLIMVRVFDRMIFAEPMQTRMPDDVERAARRILARIPKPKSISCDNEGAFASNKFKKFFKDAFIALRFKDPQDRNSLGVVDRAIGLIKRKASELGGLWQQEIPKAIRFLNATPKPEVLHGASPNEVKYIPEVYFMLQQDNADKLKHNNDLQETRVRKIREAGGFRAPVDYRNPIRKRVFEPNFATDVIRSDGRVGSRVVVDAVSGRTVNTKRVRPARPQN